MRALRTGAPAGDINIENLAESKGRSAITKEVPVEKFLDIIRDGDYKYGLEEAA